MLLVFRLIDLFVELEFLSQHLAHFAFGGGVLDLMDEFQEVSIEDFGFGLIDEKSEGTRFLHYILEEKSKH